MKILFNVMHFPHTSVVLDFSALKRLSWRH